MDNKKEDGVVLTYNADGQDALLEYSLPPDPKAVPAARYAVAQVCRQEQVSEEMCAELDLALGEALANAVLHGGKYAPQKNVGLSLWRYDNSLIVKVHDSGPGFNPPDPPYPMPDPEVHATHGRGLPLMQILTDAMVVCRGDAGEGGESIFLVKKMDGPPN